MYRAVVHSFAVREFPHMIKPCLPSMHVRTRMMVRAFGVWDHCCGAVAVHGLCGYLIDHGFHLVDIVTKSRGRFRELLSVVCPAALEQASAQHNLTLWQHAKCVSQTASAMCRGIAQEQRRKGIHDLGSCTAHIQNAWHAGKACLMQELQHMKLALLCRGYCTREDASCPLVRRGY